MHCFKWNSIILLKLMEFIVIHPWCITTNRKKATVHRFKKKIFESNFVQTYTLFYENFHLTMQFHGQHFIAWHYMN